MTGDFLHEIGTVVCETWEGTYNTSDFRKSLGENLVSGLKGAGYELLALPREPGDERAWRQVLWGLCPHVGKYGDDGEMQCRGYDFRRMDAWTLRDHVEAALRLEPNEPDALILGMAMDLESEADARGVVGRGSKAARVAARYASLRSGADPRASLDAGAFAAAMQAEGERHNRAMQSIIDREDPDVRWERVHNPTHAPTSCQHARLVHTVLGCSRCACLFRPDGRAG